MQKSDKIIIVAMLAVLGIAILAACIWFGVSVFSVDENASFHSGTGELIWNDTRYVEIVDLGTAADSKTLARIPDHAVVYELPEDPSQTFLKVRYGGNTYYAVREDYVVPTEGDVTAFVWGAPDWGAQYVTDETACKAIEDMLATVDTMPTFYFETDNLHYNGGDAQMIKNMHVAYDGCPVATDRVGYVGKVDGKMVYITEGTQTSATHRGGGSATIPVKCHEIPEPLATTIASYLKFE